MARMTNRKDRDPEQEVGRLGSQVQVLIMFVRCRHRVTLGPDIRAPQHWYWSKIPLS
jgi:hypothetical protein